MNNNIQRTLLQRSLLVLPLLAIALGFGLFSPPAGMRPKDLSKVERVAIDKAKPQAAISVSLPVL